MNLKKSLTPSKHVVKKSLRSHAWLGLFFSILLYLICLSGALVVFFQETERWEQPTISESAKVDIQQLETAINNAINRAINNQESLPKTLYFAPPSDVIPRAHVSNRSGGYYLNKDGSRGPDMHTPWTAMLSDLHIYLHLPNTIGIILVGLLGAMMLGLMISGILAHPSLFKDAFKLRWGGSRQLEQTDIHNRLSVWSLPFFFIVCLTGAYIGLFSITILGYDLLDDDMTTSEAVDTIFPAQLAFDAPAEPVRLEPMLKKLKNQYPEADLMFVTLKNGGQPGQYIEVNLQMPERLIYSEVFRFHNTGEYIDSKHMSDGDWGRQVAYSSYRLHFGQFGSFTIKVLYFLLGIAMAVMVATGVNIWFIKRQLVNRWYALWQGIIWGAPLSFSLALLTSILFGTAVALSFWLSYLLIAAWFFVANPNHPEQQQRLMTWVNYLRQATLAVIIVSVLSHLIHYDYALLSWFNGFNLILIVTAVLFAFLKKPVKAAAQP